MCANPDAKPPSIDLWCVLLLPAPLSALVLSKPAQLPADRLL